MLPADNQVLLVVCGLLFLVLFLTRCSDERAFAQSTKINDTGISLALERLEVDSYQIDELADIEPLRKRLSAIISCTNRDEETISVVIYSERKNMSLGNKGG